MTECAPSERRAIELRWPIRGQYDLRRCACGGRCWWDLTQRQLSVVWQLSVFWLKCFYPTSLKILRTTATLWWRSEHKQMTFLPFSFANLRARGHARTRARPPARTPARPHARTHASAQAAQQDKPHDPPSFLHRQPPSSHEPHEGGRYSWQRPSSRIRVPTGSVSALYRHRRRHVHCVGMGMPVLKMTASERRSF